MPFSDGHNSLDERRFLFVTGKGGVGKTTVCASLALALAARGKRVLIAMTGAHERLSSILATPSIGHEMQLVSERVWETKIDPERAIEEYGQMVLKVRAITRIVFDNAYTKAIFRAIPGIYEWAMLGKAWFHTTEQLADGSPRFDVVLLDAPSTGHGLDMLRVPKVILDVVPPGVLRRDAERAWELFKNPSTSGVVVVSWPEQLPVTETIELVGALRDELSLPIVQVVLNGVLAPLFSSEQRAVLLADRELTSIDFAKSKHSTAELALAAAARRAVKESVQNASMKRLQDELGVPIRVLPFLLESAGTPDGARLLAGKL